MRFEVGAMYSSQEIQVHLEVGNAGGIRVAVDSNKKVKRMVVLTANPTTKIERENPYHDRIEGSVLVYAAAGLTGDQSLGGVNKRLITQPQYQFPIYGFRINESRRKAGVRRWEFIGLLQVLRFYPDSQVDRAGMLRKVWLFEFRVCREIARVDIPSEAALARQVFDDYSFDVLKEERLTTAKCAEFKQNEADPDSIERIRAKLLVLSPREFELLVLAALQHSGFADAKVTRYSQDGGIDVNGSVGENLWPIAGTRVQLQVKRWLHTVGRREVAELRGSLEPFALGAVVTTSFFSRAALLEANMMHRQKIVLIDGYRFASLASATKLVAVER